MNKFATTKKLFTRFSKKYNKNIFLRRKKWITKKEEKISIQDKSIEKVFVTIGSNNRGESVVASIGYCPDLSKKETKKQNN